MDHTPPPEESAFALDAIHRRYRRARAGDVNLMVELFSPFRGRLNTVIRLRVDSRLRGRLDATDVLQETYIECERRFLRDAPQHFEDFYLWVRSITLQKLIDLSRHHLATQKRSVSKEVSLRIPTGVQASSLAFEISASQTSPSQKAVRSEDFASLHLALDNMNEQDRDILALRHFEELSNEQVATILDISKTAASNRYVRALQRLEQVLRSAGMSAGEF